MSSFPSLPGAVVSLMASPESIKSATEQAGTQCNDGVGAIDAPEHTGSFEPLPDDHPAAGLDHAGANAQALGAEMIALHMRWRLLAKYANALAAFSPSSSGLLFWQLMACNTASSWPDSSRRYWSPAHGLARSVPLPKMAGASSLRCSLAWYRSTTGMASGATMVARFQIHAAPSPSKT